MSVTDTKINVSNRSPICCIMGHVDAGKTSLLDSIRQTSIASNEAGGITQQIGATFISKDFIQTKTKKIKGKFSTDELNIPGFLMIDTPGHEAFFKLRERGTSMCDIAILAIDIFEGIQPQTKEVIELLKKSKIPFVIAATKLDRVWGWKSLKDSIIRKSFRSQSKTSQNSFEGYIESLKIDLNKEGIKSEFYFKNKNPQKIHSIIPVCSLHNEGISDLMAFISYIATNLMNKKLITKEKLKASIMEVFYDKKIGWIMDVIIVNGIVSIGDTVIVPSLNDSSFIEIKIKNILLPSLTTEMDKSKSWKSYSSVQGACGVRIIANDLKNVIAGGHLYSTKDYPIDKAIEKASQEVSNLFDELPKNESGVILMAETLGALEASSYLLVKEKIPVKHYQIGKISEKLLDHLAIMMDNQVENNKVILYFGKISTDKKVSNKNLTLIHNEVIYQLIEKYHKFKLATLKNITTRLLSNGEAVLPVKMMMLKEFLFVKGGTQHFLLGVKVIYGRIYKNMPVTIVSKGKILHLGNIESIQKEKDSKEEAFKGDKVCLKISNDNHLTLGRQFDESWIMYSNQTRKSIDNLKRYFKDVLTKEDWLMVIEQKKALGIK